jgi:hypothetical protein
MRNWRYAVIAVATAVVIVTWSGLPSWSHTALLVVLMVGLAVFTYHRRIWMTFDADAND